MTTVKARRIKRISYTRRMRKLDKIMKREREGITKTFSFQLLEEHGWGEDSGEYPIHFQNGHIWTDGVSLEYDPVFSLDQNLEALHELLTETIMNNQLKLKTI